LLPKSGECFFPKATLNNGKFSTVAKRIWVSQLDAIQLLLARLTSSSMKRAKISIKSRTDFLRDMNVEEFLATARELEKSIEGIL